MVGLGRMGGSMVQRLLDGGHRVVVYDRREDAVAAGVQAGAEGSGSLGEMVDKLTPPRAVWLMVPPGNATEAVITELAGMLSRGDVLLDGGNSNYKDTVRRAEMLDGRGIRMLDVGTSGGVWGLREGYSLMVGGDREVFLGLEPLFKTLAPGPDRGYGYVGIRGSGHFVKMVHNGIEYGLMEAYAEGFELLAAKEEFSLDLAQVISIWRHGSVVRSWLLDLAEQALKEDPGLDAVQSYVEDSGEGRWTVNESIDLGVPAPVIALSLQARFRSRQVRPFGGRVLAALRNQFGGHRARASGCEES